MSSSKRGRRESAESSKAAKSSEQASPSASATASGGYRELSSRFQSCLLSPLALPLIYLTRFGCGASDTNCPLLKEYCGQDNDDFEKAKRWGEAVFIESVNEWDGKLETTFTDELLGPKLREKREELSKATQSSQMSQMRVDSANCKQSLPANADNHNETEATQDSQLGDGAADSQQSLPVKTDKQFPMKGEYEDGARSGKADLLIWERNTKSRAVARPISVVEVGVRGKYNLWQKIHQGLLYVDMMCNPTPLKSTIVDNEVRETKFDLPMLLSSIIIGKSDGGVDCEFAVFLCVPVPPPNDSTFGSFRVILLWRKKVLNSVEEASEAFGKICEASIALQAWRKEKLGVEYEYLGPNCARVGNRLYRSYDTRFRCTDRSPKLYLPQENSPIGFHWYPASETRPENQAAKTVLDVQDGDPQETLPFGEDRPPGDKKEWLWGNRGRLLVISVPFRDGVHFAQKLSDFIPILNHLQYLHENGKVHGDIRAFNMVFRHNHEERETENSGDTSEKAKSYGWLIDLDFGGNAGEATYPEKYNYALTDGTRLKPSEDGPKKIQKFHDLYALWQVVNNMHRPAEDTSPDHEFFLQQFQVSSLLEDSQDDNKMQEQLRAYLSKWGHLKLNLARAFKAEIENFSKQQKNGNEGKGRVNPENPSPHKDAKTNAVATGSFHA